MKSIGNHSSILKDRAGFSLVELLLVVGVLGIVGAATTSLLLSHLRINSNTQLKVSIQEAIQLQKIALRNNEVCKQAFETKQLAQDDPTPGLWSLPATMSTPLVLTTDADPSTAANLAVGRSLSGFPGATGTTVTELRLVGMSTPSTDATTGIRRAAGYIQVKVELNAPQFGQVESRMPISYSFNGAGQITDCETIIDSSNTTNNENTSLVRANAETCTTLGLAFDDSNGRCRLPAAVTGKARFLTPDAGTASHPHVKFWRDIRLENGMLTYRIRTEAMNPILPPDWGPSVEESFGRAGIEIPDDLDDLPAEGLPIPNWKQMYKKDATTFPGISENFRLYKDRITFNCGGNNCVLRFEN